MRRMCRGLWYVSHSLIDIGSNVHTQSAKPRQRRTEIPYCHFNWWLSSSPVLRYHDPIQIFDSHALAYAAQEDEEINDERDKGKKADEEGLVEDPVLQEGCQEKWQHVDCGGDPCLSK